MTVVIDPATGPAVESAPPVRRRPARPPLLVLLAFVVIGLAVASAVAAGLLAPGSPTHANAIDRFTPPAWLDGGSWEHVLGTDSLGRDVLSRIVYGARISMVVGVCVVLLSAAVGTAAGVLAGYRGGRVDAFIMRFADAQLAFPGLLFVILVLAFADPSVPVIILVIAAYGWMIYARVARGLVLQVKSSQRVVAAELLGCSRRRIIVKHVLPALAGPLVTQGLLEFARVVLVESSLSYLGLGVQPPDASWGLMVAENQGQMTRAWWTIVFPGAALAVTVLALNIVGGWLRERTATSPGGISTPVRVRGARAASAGLPALNGAAAPLLSVADLGVTYRSASGDVAALDGVSLTIPRGSTLGVVGESGSGKSSLALALLGLLPPTGHATGTASWNGAPVSLADLAARRGRDVTMIFQDPMTSLNPLVPIGRQVGEVLTRHGDLSRQAARDRTVELFDLVGIPSARRRVEDLPHQLSGGLRQRVMIAMALAPSPSLVIADEPTTALDATIQAQILDLLADLKAELGIAMLLISHDLGVVASVCDDVAVLYGGQLMERAPVRSFFASPQHRYSEALLAALPRPDRAEERLVSIPGRPPERLHRPTGCPFHPRCERATEICLTAPELTVQADRAFACWHPTGMAP